MNPAELGFERLDVAWILVAAALVMFMQGGFCYLESGLSRAKNSWRERAMGLVKPKVEV